MAKKPKVLINSLATSYNDLFPGDKYLVVNSEEWLPCDLVLLVGHHTDVDPALYGASKLSECGLIDRQQDELSFHILTMAHTHKVPVIGVCKGAQQLCVFKGGYLIQHVPRVGGHRVVLCSTAECFEDVPADHHQVMVVPDDYRCRVTMVNWESRYPDVFEWRDYGDRCVGIQFHPEWVPKDHPIRLWFNDKVKEMLKK